MAVLGVSSITPAFPKIAQVMNISQAVGLLITVFTLPGVILTPVLVYWQTVLDEREYLYLL